MDNTKPEFDIEKLKVLMSYWINHNNDHIRDNEKWLHRVEDIGLEGVAEEIKKVIALSMEANKHIEAAAKKVNDSSNEKIAEKHKHHKPAPHQEGDERTDRVLDLELKQIGIVKTPYKDNAPHQPVDDDEGDFQIIIDSQYIDGLNRLNKFKYIYVLYYMDRVTDEVSMTVLPKWTGGEQAGVFASRAPVRPNQIGLSVVRIKGIEKNIITTSGLDMLNGTPVLDIKPYIKDLDSKPESNCGWIEEIEGYEHLLQHMKGVSHDHHHHHE